MVETLKMYIISGIYDEGKIILIILVTLIFEIDILEHFKLLHVLELK